MTKDTNQPVAEKAIRPENGHEAAPSAITELVIQEQSSEFALPGEKENGKPLLIIALIIGLLILVAVYFFADYDPLGLFNKPATAPPVDLVGIEEHWWQVHFTAPKNNDYPEDFADSVPHELIGHINDAQHTIHIASFEFDLPEVADALIAARKRGVEVRWITDDEHGAEADEDTELELFDKLRKAGIEVKDDGRGALMHNKFWIFDRKMAWTGSTNITVNGNFRNNNNVLVINSLGVAEIFEREFAEMWAGQFGPTSPSTVDDQQVTIDGTPIQILFAAEDEVASHLVPLIQSAQKNIRFMAFSFTHDELGAAVLERAEAGVDVKGIFETRGSETEFSELPTMYCAGLSVRQDGNPGILHHKVFVIDDEILITGSYNFSENADDSNDENVVIITSRDIAARYLWEFQHRWAEANEPNAARMNCK